MSSIIVEHLGAKIGYNEDSDTWYCHDHDMRGMKSLKAIKTAISKRDADERRLGGIAAYEISEWGSPTPKRCSITMLTEDRKGAWISKDGRREKTSLNRLVLDTEQARSAMAKLLANNKKIAALNEENKKLFDEIPRVTLDYLVGREAA